MDRFKKGVDKHGWRKHKSKIYKEKYRKKRIISLKN